jgi:hypothetical protein
MAVVACSGRSRKASSGWAGLAWQSWSGLNGELWRGMAIRGQSCSVEKDARPSSPDE